MACIHHTHMHTIIVNEIYWKEKRVSVLVWFDLAFEIGSHSIQLFSQVLRWQAGATMLGDWLFYVLLFFKPFALYIILTSIMSGCKGLLQHSRGAESSMPSSRVPGQQAYLPRPVSVCGIWDRTQGLVRARQVLYQLRCVPNTPHF